MPFENRSLSEDVFAIVVLLHRSGIIGRPIVLKDRL